MQREESGSWVNKNALDRVLAEGIHGTPEIKHDEKIHYLGEFRERVIRMLTKEQVEETAVYPEILQSLKDQRAAKVIISGDINYSSSEKYRRLAVKMGKTCTVVHDPALVGNVGLVVVGNNAVDVAVIEVPDRKTRLAQLGVPASLADAAGKKVCEKCYQKITEADPEEVINYRKLTLADRFWGEYCAAC
ncbi:YueI family protein [Desulfoscipio gibsoniae]|nr:YueI family protein [Desulfoscipio gibsoniae]